MINLFDPTHEYHAGNYKCNRCQHQTIIFIDSKYSMFGTMEADKICCICYERKPTVTDGDLVIRYDWPDANNYPWQLQSGCMKEGERYCKACESKALKDWRKIIVLCSQCDGYMQFNNSID